MSKHLLPAKNKKLNLLQACRGIAALLVLMAHTTAFSMEQFHQPFLLNRFLFGVSSVDIFLY